MPTKSAARTITRNPDTLGPAVHPGVMLLEEFLKPLGQTQVEAARALGMSVNRLNELILGKRGVTADTALRLARVFKTTPQVWMHLQADWDLHEAIAEALGGLEGLFREEALRRESLARPTRMVARSSGSRSAACRPAPGSWPGRSTNPAAATAASVSRLGWQPPVNHVQAGCVRSCIRAATRTAGANVLQHPQRTSRPQHPPHLGEAARHVADAAEDEAAHHGVEGPVAEGQRLGPGAERAARRGRGAAPSGATRGRGRGRPRARLRRRAGGCGRCRSRGRGRGPRATPPASHERQRPRPVFSSSTIPASYSHGICSTPRTGSLPARARE